MTISPFELPALTLVLIFTVGFLSLRLIAASVAAYLYRRKRNAKLLAGCAFFAHICPRFVIGVSYVAPAPDREMVVQSAQTGHALRAPGDLKSTMRLLSF